LPYRPVRLVVGISPITSKVPVNRLLVISLHKKNKKSDQISSGQIYIREADIKNDVVGLFIYFKNNELGEVQDFRKITDHFRGL
jgi:hypothetical protein